MPTVYGLAQRLGPELRLNTFTATSSIGYTTPFQITDYTYDVQVELPCIVRYPASSHGISGGGVFAIILFVSIAAYIVFGALYVKKFGRRIQYSR